RPPLDEREDTSPLHGPGPRRSDRHRRPPDRAPGTRRILLLRPPPYRRDQHRRVPPPLRHRADRRVPPRGASNRRRPNRASSRPPAPDRARPASRRHRRRDLRLRRARKAGRAALAPTPQLPRTRAAAGGRHFYEVRVERGPGGERAALPAAPPHEIRRTSRPDVPRRQVLALLPRQAVDADPHGLELYRR